MRLAITQPNFMPWLGYFELLDYVDVWVSLDNVQLSRGSFVLRNRVRRPDGELEWISVNIPKKSPLHTSIKDVQISANDWQERIIRRLESYYKLAPFYQRFEGQIAELLTSNKNAPGLAALNESIIGEVSSWLGIEYEFYRASDIEPTLEGSPQDKAGLYAPTAFAKQGVMLERHGYAHPTYPQHSGGFKPFLSIVDLLFESGEGALDVIRSGRNWQTV
jgi:hypothetical protein